MVFFCSRCCGSSNGQQGPKTISKQKKSRDPELNSNWGTICTLVHLTSEDEKRHKEINESNSQQSNLSEFRQVAVFDISKKSRGESRNKLVSFMPTLNQSTFF